MQCLAGRVRDLLDRGNGGGGICLNCVSHVNDNLECEGGGGEGGGLSHKPQYTLTHMYK